MAAVPVSAQLPDPVPPSNNDSIAATATAAATADAASTVNSSEQSANTAAASEAAAAVSPTGVITGAASDATIDQVAQQQRAHVDARGLALTIIATVAMLFAIHSAQKFLVPLLFGIFIAFTLNPVVVWLENVRLPRVVGSSMVMLVLIGGILGGARTLTTEFMAITETLPEMAHKLSRELTRNQSNQPGALQRMRAAATEIESATSGTKVKPAPAAPVASTASRVNDLVMAGSMGAAGFVGEVVVVLFLIFFLLLSGDTFKRKLVKMTGPSLSNKKITVHIVDDINTSIQKYMFMLLVTNSLLTVLMWIAFRMIGLDNAGAWAVGAGLLHVIPYFGPLLITVGTGLAAFMQFGTLSMALLTAVASMTIATLVGTFVTTWMTGRIAKMNATAVFVSLLFWGWMWGIWGMLLGVPIVVIIRVVSEHIEGLQPVAELLGD